VQDIVDLGAVAAGNDALLQLLGSGKIAKIATFCELSPAPFVLHQIFTDVIGVLAIEIISFVWDTPANFNEFRILAALLHGTSVLGVSQTLRR